MKKLSIALEAFCVHFFLRFFCLTRPQSMLPFHVDSYYKNAWQERIGQGTGIRNAI